MTTQALMAVAVALLLCPRSWAQTMRLVEDKNTQTGSSLSTTRSYGDRAALSVQLGNDPQAATWVTDGTTEGTARLSLPFDDQYWTSGYGAVVGDWLVYESFLSNTTGLWLYNITTLEAHRLTTTQVSLNVFGDTVLYEELEGPTPHARWRLDPLSSVTPRRLPESAPIPGGGAVRIGERVYFTRRDSVSSNASIWSYSLEDGTAQQITPAFGIQGSINTVGGTIVGLEHLGNAGYAIYRFDPRSGVLDHRVLMDHVPNFNEGFTWVAAERFWCEANARLPSGSNSRVVYRYDPTNGTLDVVPLQVRNTAIVIYYPTIAPDGLYFANWDAATGYEAYRLGPTSAAPELVADIRPGPTSSVGTGGVSYQAGKIWITGTDDAHGSELWVHDPATRETRFVKDINPGPAGSSIRILGSVGTIVLFAADDGVHGSELWRSDGTEAGTFLLRDFQTGTNGSLPRTLRRLGHHLIYSNGGIRVVEGDDVVAIPAPDSLAFSGDLLGVARNRDGREVAYEFARSAISTRPRMVVSDGTPEGTIAIDVPAINDSSPCSAVSSGYGLGQLAVNDLGIVLALSSSTGCDPWILDLSSNSGTGGSATRLVDLNPSSTSSPTDIRDFVACGDAIFFVATSVERGTELWKSHGTAETTASLDLAPGSESSYPGWLTPAGESLYFVSRSSGARLVRSLDVATGSARTIASFGIDTIPSRLAFLGSELVFSTTSPSGSFLWSVDLASGALRQIPGPTPFSGLHGWTDDDSMFTGESGRLYFVADDEAGPGTEGDHASPFVYDPRVGEIRRLARGIYQHNPVVTPLYLTTIHNQVLFAMNDGTHGQELWVTDGTPEGTRLFLDAVPGPASSSPTEATLVGNTLYLAATTPEFGTELYALDLCGGDLNLDFTVTTDDLLLFLDALETGSSVADIADESGAPFPDGAVTISDLIFMLSHLEDGC